MIQSIRKELLNAYKKFSTEVPELKSNQEEVQTHLVMHIKHACDIGIQNILVVSEDTDAKAFLLANVDLFNDQSFENVKFKIAKEF